ncbi:MAG TPA: IS200/IS605 family transposase [Pyrinomonadaceae bacterium]
MNLTYFTTLKWAYQLHYYLCFRTHRRRQRFLSRESVLEALITEICERHEYHLLECQPHPEQLRSLISLRPDQAVAKVIQTIKTNSSREWNLRFQTAPPLWARGYLARSTGQVRIGAVRNTSNNSQRIMVTNRVYCRQSLNIELLSLSSVETRGF